jgi:mRNA-degrading endonuclease YafQ of YafQ-DinJ toxin-antitoxin module
MIYETSYDDLFADHFERLTLKERRIVEKKINIMKHDLDHPSLRTQPLHRFPAMYESSISMDIRVIWRIVGNVIVFVDIGHHDILKIYG